jgi:hypothetical protein
MEHYIYALKIKAFKGKSFALWDDDGTVVQFFFNK